MKLVDAESMIGVDIAIIDTDRYARWKDLRDGQHGVKATLVAVGKYRLTSQGWCNVTGYEALDYGTNACIARYEVNRHDTTTSTTKVTSYMIVPLNSLMSWATYTRIHDERKLRDTELEVMAETKSALKKELALLRYDYINRMTRERRTGARKSVTAREYWTRASENPSFLVVEFHWDPAWDTKAMADIERRIAVITEKLECRR